MPCKVVDTGLADNKFSEGIKSPCMLYNKSLTSFTCLKVIWSKMYLYKILSVCSRIFNNNDSAKLVAVLYNHVYKSAKML